jgi:hypothetical protein
MILSHISIIICTILMHNYSYRNYVITFILPCIYNITCSSGVTRGGGCWGLVQIPPKCRSFDKPEPNSQFCGKKIHNNLIKIRDSLICKLSRIPDYGATTPRPPFSLPSVLNWICWTTPAPRPKFLGTPLTCSTSLTGVSCRICRV